MEWSSYQVTLFEAMRKGTDNLMVRACAGGAKSTSLIEGSRPMRNAVFVAYSRTNVSDFKEKLGSDRNVKSLYGVGLGAIIAHQGKLQREGNEVEDIGDPEPYKYNPLIKAEARRLTQKLQTEYLNTYACLKELTKFCMVTLTDPQNDEAFVAMLDHFELSLPMLLPERRKCGELIAGVLEEGEKMARTEGIISFDDMLYLPWKWKLPIRQYGTVIADEVGDVSAGQLNLILGMMGDYGRLVAAGDERQCIYSFTGADARSYRNIKDRTEAVEMVLPVCYRCSKAVVGHAQTIVGADYIQAAPNAPDGSVSEIDECQLIPMLEAGDFVLCRLNAPLVSLCLALIARKIPAKIRGRDIGARVASLAKQVANHYPMMPFKAFEECVNRWENERVMELLKEEDCEAKVSRLHDMMDVLLCCYTGSNARTIDEFVAEIEALFSDEEAAIWLSTIHSGKGLEYKRVFILKPEEIKRRARTPSQIREADNLSYVAATRAKEDLFFVRSA